MKDFTVSLIRNEVAVYTNFDQRITSLTYDSLLHS